jgi:hypothetical protein
MWFLVSSLTLFGSVAKDLYIREGLAAYHAVAQLPDEMLGTATERTVRRP